MDALVTGASGHVGTNLIRSLLKQGKSVRALLHTGTQLAADLKGNVDEIYGDIRHFETMHRACTGVDVVYHLAAIISITGPQNGLVHDVNVIGARTMAKAALASNVRRYLHVSSIHAFDINQGPDLVVDEDTSRSGSMHPAYDKSKWEAEQELHHVIGLGLDAVIVNPTGIIGPGDNGESRMGRVLLNLFRNRMWLITDSGFNWIDVRDVVDGMILAAEKGKTGENFILAGHWQSLIELASMITEISGRKVRYLKVPLWSAYLSIPFFKLIAALQGKEPICTMESLHAIKATKHISSRKAQDLLHFNPRPIMETLQAIMDDFIKAKLIAPRAEFARRANS